MATIGDEDGEETALGKTSAMQDDVISDERSYGFDTMLMVRALELHIEHGVHRCLHKK